MAVPAGIGRGAACGVRAFSGLASGAGAATEQRQAEETSGKQRDATWFRHRDICQRNGAAGVERNRPVRREERVQQFQRQNIRAVAGDRRECHRVARRHVGRKASPVAGNESVAQAVSSVATVMATRRIKISPVRRKIWLYHPGIRSISFAQVALATAWGKGNRWRNCRQSSRSAIDRLHVSPSPPHAPRQDRRRPSSVRASAATAAASAAPAASSASSRCCRR